MCSRAGQDRAYLSEFSRSRFIPNNIILRVLGCTLLCTSAEAERSLSLLRLIKSHMRSWKADTRFSALTLMKIYHSKQIDIKKTEDRLINEQPIRLFKASLFN